MNQGELGNQRTTREQYDLDLARLMSQPSQYERLLGLLEQSMRMQERLLAKWEADHAPHD